MTGINRRQFSLLLGGALLSPALIAANHKGAPLFASAATNRDGQHSLQLVDAQGNVMLDHPLPGRAHHVAVHPHKPWLAAVARRPGTYIDILDYRQGRLIKRIKADTDRHFYGHAIFSADGTTLIAAENQISSGQGRITMRNLAQDFSLSADYPSYGIGPHELAQMPDGNTLVVANGGILTHPDQGRDKLNLDSMQPSLAYIDLHSGQLLEQIEPPAEQHQLSIRHLDVNAQGKVVIALQYQGPRHHQVPLIAMHERGAELQLLQAPAAVNQQMKLYCGSARFDSSGRFAAVSSPRGDLVTFWDSNSGEYLGRCKARDGCGLAATSTEGEFLISSGLGRVYRYQLQQNRKSRLPLSQALKGQAWDNHMISLI